MQQKERDSNNLQTKNGIPQNSESGERTGLKLAWVIFQRYQLRDDEFCKCRFFLRGKIRKDK